MLAAFALTVQLLDDAPRLAQAPQAREQQLQGEIDDLNTQLRNLKTDWPVGAVVGAYFGFSLAGLALSAALVLVVAGTLLSGSVGGALLVAGLVTVVLGGLALALAIYSIIAGSTAQDSARAERNELIRQRETKERELKQLHESAPPAGVERPREPSPLLVTVATF